MVLLDNKSRINVARAIHDLTGGQRRAMTVLALYCREKSGDYVGTTREGARGLIGRVMRARFEASLPDGIVGWEKMERRRWWVGAEGRRVLARVEKSLVEALVVRR